MLVCQWNDIIKKKKFNHLNLFVVIFIQSLIGMFDYYELICKVG